MIVFTGALKPRLCGVRKISVAGVSKVRSTAQDFLLDAEYIGAIVQIVVVHAPIFMQRGLIFSLLRLRHRLRLHFAVGVVPRRLQRDDGAESNNDSQQRFKFLVRAGRSYASACDSNISRWQTCFIKAADAHSPR